MSVRSIFDGRAHQVKGGPMETQKERLSEWEHSRNSPQKLSSKNFDVEEGEKYTGDLEEKMATSEATGRRKLERWNRKE